MVQNEKTIKFSSQNEFEEVVLNIARVSRVVAGGKRLNFRATVVIGNKAGKVGLGVAKGADVNQAITKASQRAKKNLMIVPIVERTIPFDVKAKFKSAEVILKPARQGRGIIAGGATRVILALAGITNVTAKILGKTSNAINNAQATIKALRALKVKN